MRIETDSPVESLAQEGKRWRVRTQRDTFAAPVIVNAAGAWGDEVASLAGAAPGGLVPKRRTVVLVDLPADERARRWPAAVHVEETFYFKPDAGQLLVSPADETPSAPCDAQPDEFDIAVAIDRFEQTTGQPVRKLRSRWAGCAPCRRQDAGGRFRPGRAGLLLARGARRLRHPRPRRGDTGRAVRRA